MYGQAPLIAMRREGVAPSSVWISADPRGALDPARDWQDWSPTRAHLQLETGDVPKRLDLRCVVGLLCFIDGLDRQRVLDTRDACIAAGAKQVLASVLVRTGGGEYRTVEVFDGIEQLAGEKEESNG